ncbi:hypothetical protein [Paraburkholderia sp. BL25I1N1]|uniref:hypothetical protein n=1 Tax=Paraburkholderia sp. BL25I1N1 TaxID=1938804 RepID=UPI0015E5E1D8|nr:hypothetical protein [Paraburkholderia sp. BL25I1N1]
MAHPFCKLGFGDSGEDSHAGNVGSGWSGWRDSASAMCGKCGIGKAFLRRREARRYFQCLTAKVADRAV